MRVICGLPKLLILKENAVYIDRYLAIKYTPSENQKLQNYSSTVRDRILAHSNLLILYL